MFVSTDVYRSCRPRPTATRYFYLPSTFGIYRKFYEKFASSNTDNETFCTVLLTSQVVSVQSLQPKGPEFEST